MKRLKLCILSAGLWLSNTPALMAQMNVIYSNESFPEPNEGVNRLMMMKDGSIAHINAGEKGLMVRIFGTDKKMKASGLVAYPNVPGSNIKTFFPEIVMDKGGNIVVLLSGQNECGFGGMIHCVKHLFRVVINGADAKKIDATEIATAGKVRDNGYRLNILEVNDFYVTEDKDKDEYAVVLFDGYQLPEQKDRVQVAVFGADNKLLRKAILSGPSVNGRFVHFGDVLLHDKTVSNGADAFIKG